MTGAFITNILLALLAIMIPVVAFFSATRANRDQARASSLAVDAAAYSRAKDIYEGALATLQSEMTTQREETHRMRVSNDKLRESNDALRMEIHRLREEITALRATRQPDPNS